MVKRKLIRAMALLVGSVISVSSLSALIGCTNNGSGTKDSIVLMTEELSNLFNPFYATAGTDMDVVGFTQIGMLTYDADDEGNVTVVSGDEHAVVSKAHDVKESADGNDTVYTFVIKNGLKFSDGVPLTINDVLFNMYEYLDPVYTGSSTMYSVKIKGLTQYRTQTYASGGGTAEEEAISRSAAGLARMRRQELIDIFEEKGRLGSGSASFNLSEERMKEEIAKWDVSDGYKEAIATEAERAEIGSDVDYYRNQLLKDYEFVCKTFKEEIQSDFKAAKESFDLNSKPYSDWTSKLSNDLFKFFLYEGYIVPKYAKREDKPGQDNKEKIESFSGEDYVTRYPTEEAAVQRVYDDNISTALNAVLQYWGTAGTVLTEYTGTATAIVIRNNMKGSELLFPNISGIVSLGHTTGADRVNSVTINNKTYNVAHEHNADGTPVNPDEYDVLQITVEGKDPKAIYSFGFSVAPAHYYGVGAGYNNGNEIDIANNKFGVEYLDPNFQSNVVKSLEHVEVPVGAGPYMATNRNNSNNPKGSEFVNSNIVYYKANPYFMFDVKAEKLRLRVVGSSDALDVLASGEVDYVTPQFTKANYDKLMSMTNSGYVKMDSWQLGYGYIGINAGKVPNINIRRAIMAAMNTELAIGYYQAGTCQTIDWPMSMMSWAYPYVPGTHTAPGVGTSKQNGHDYTQWTGETDARTNIKRYMDLAEVSAGDPRLKIKFTIAGASITEHPTYEVFKKASEILNDMGWDITVSADTDALTKLSTGSLEVWAAAWGSSIDPDMYQIYHKNSSATSPYAWGYREIKADTRTYATEMGIINELSAIIDDAREIMDQNKRAEKYEDAMRLVLDLAVEMPVYQRQNLYAYNGNTVKGFAEKVNAYTSPLDKVWNLELIK